MRYLIVLALTTIFTSCAHHHKAPEHHHHAYDKQCAYSVAHGEVEINGKNEFKATHSGKTYYFSSRQKLHLFEENLKENISKADENWARNR